MFNLFRGDQSGLEGEPGPSPAMPPGLEGAPQPTDAISPPEPVQREPEIILHPPREERQHPERDLTAKIFLPTAVRKEILRYIDPQAMDWSKKLRQFDFEQRVDADRAQQGLLPINPGRIHRDRNKMEENFTHFDDVKRQYAESLYWGGEIVPLTLVDFLDWRIGHKQMHIKKAQEEGNKSDKEKSQKEIDKLEKWKKTILNLCPIKK